MLRFTIRELFLLTLAISLGIGWWVDRANDAWRIGSVRRHAMALRDSLAQAEHNEAVYVDKLAEVYGLDTAGLADLELIEIEWELADRMIP